MQVAARSRIGHRLVVGIRPQSICIGEAANASSNYIEHPELVAQRLKRFAAIVGGDRVMAGSDCGFSIFAGGGLVDPRSCLPNCARWRTARHSRRSGSGRGELCSAAQQMVLLKLGNCQGAVRSRLAA